MAEEAKYRDYVGSFHNKQAKQEQQTSSSSTSTSSKIARCSITTNRKSTTSHKLVSSSGSSLKGSSLSLNKSLEPIEASEQQVTQQVGRGQEIVASLHVEPIRRGSIRTSMELNLSAPSNKDHLDRRTTLTNGYLDAKRRIELEREEESSVHHRQSFSKTNTSTRDSGGLRKAAISSSSLASEAALVSRHLSHHHQHDGGTSSSISADMSASSSRHFATSAALILSGNEQTRRTGEPLDDDDASFLNQESLFSSPDVRSLVREIGTEFAELENALSSSSTAGGLSQQTSRSSLSSRLFGGRRLLSPIGAGPQYPAISNSSSASQNLFDEPLRERDVGARQIYSQRPDQLSLRGDTSDGHVDSRYSRHYGASVASESTLSNKDKIQELLSKVQNHTNVLPETSLLRLSTQKPDEEADDDLQTNDRALELRGTTLEQALEKAALDKEDATTHHLSVQSHRKAVMTESIERIDQRMSDLCKKFEECHDTKEAIDLLEIMIQMIEKAWSVPVCGDDLGFKLCNSLREAGGLDIILGFIQDSDDQGLLSSQSDSCLETAGVQSDKSSNDTKQVALEAASCKQLLEPAKSSVQKRGNGATNPLRLNLSKVIDATDVIGSSSPPLAIEQESSNNQGQSQQQSQSCNGHTTTVKDSDSDILTSDLGLDSTSVESLSYVSAAAQAAAETSSSKQIDKEGIEQEEKGDNELAVKESVDESTTSDEADLEEDVPISVPNPLADEQLNEEEANLRKEELVFLSARLLSQCLTSENRNYIVENGLHPVIKLACNFTTMKSNQSQRLMSRSTIIRQSSNVAARKISRTNTQQQVATVAQPLQAAKSVPTVATSNIESNLLIEESQQQQKQKQQHLGDNSDMHAIIGTEILQHLFKHSEDTCSKMISLGGLQAILYGCRSSNIDTLRHCASALANLALYGGSDSQQTMIEHKAHVWLFPLAFNEDDNIQYYACLAIVVLVANQEIEADVLKSTTLDLVEPFVTSHEPQKFAESTTSHIHGQSASWLRKLIPLLVSKREEARNLACFHFAMEAHIKREQAQTHLFKEIGAVEPLNKVASSPRPIASKFACQALRLIGEKEPHRLSQQVPLWTNEDVLVWVQQIGFDQFESGFVDSCVDGDLLLQLNDDMLRLDIGIENGIIRRRFLRELANLKQIADYSSVDKSGLCNLLQADGRDFVQYIYPMLQLGVTKDNIHLLDSEQLLRECNVNNTIHRLKLAHSIKQLQERIAVAAASSERNSFDGTDEKTLDVFISYRRSTGSQLASLLKVHLQLRGFSVFIDVERLEAGKFDNNLLDSIKTAKNFILVLSPNALDRCIGDHECKDWVHKEIVAALASNCNIIPIMDSFHWPDGEQLPEDMRSITYFNGVRWIHDYQDACVDKVERFIRGELYNGAFCAGPQSSSAQSTIQRLPGTSPCNGAYCSTPSTVATPSITSFPNANSTGNYSTRPPPFDADHHPLSFSSPFLQQHSQNSPQTTRR